ncbi:MAG TPA: condensation domain-containing protein, partial [Candidatus Angelobacter sp.]
MSTKRIEGFRLSPQQAQLWALSGAEGRPFCAYCLVRIDGPLEQGQFARALYRVIDRHEILRSVFSQVTGMEVPLQVIGKPRLSLSFSESNSGANTNNGGIPAAGFALVGQRALDLKQGPMLQAVLVRENNLRHALMLCLYAGCADATSLKNLLRDLCRCYAAAASEDLPDVSLQYVDFAQWHNELLESAGSEEGRRYWEGRFHPDAILASIGHPHKAQEEKFLPDILREAVPRELREALNLLE